MMQINSFTFDGYTDRGLQRKRPNPVPGAEPGTGDEPNSILGQNYPNPFTGETTINYELPEEVSQAELVVRNLVTGQVMRRQKVTAKEKEATLTTGELAAGMYIYSLVVNEQILATKKMIILK